MDARAPDRNVRAWDLPTRVFHWSLVLLIAAAWVSAEFAEKLGDATLRWHRWIGIAILVLGVWRLIWGFVGAPTSRFASFLRGPGVALGYARDLATGRVRHYLGHNPLGAWMIVALVAVVLAQAGTGLFTNEHNDLASGPLAKLVPEAWEKAVRRWHHILFDYLLLPLAGLHILANVLYGVVKRDPLVRAMITGSKPAADYEDGGAEVTDAILLALVCLALAAAIVLGGITLAGGRLL